MRSDEFRALLTSLVESATAGRVDDTARLASAVESAFRDATATKLSIPAGFHENKALWRDVMAQAPVVDDTSQRRRAEALRSFDRAYSQLTSLICEQVPPVLNREGVTELTRSLLLAHSESPGEISSGSLSTREDRVTALVNSIAATVREWGEGKSVTQTQRLVSRAAELAWFCSTATRRAAPSSPTRCPPSSTAKCSPWAATSPSRTACAPPPRRWKAASAPATC